MRGRLCGLLKFFLDMLHPRQRVCSVAMEMCAVGLPLAPRLCPPKVARPPDWMLSGAVGTAWVGGG